jgi:hypothetical protein
MREYEWHGLIVGDADAAADAIGIRGGAAYQAYVRREWTRYRKPPGPVAVDPVTQRLVYPLRWHDRDEWARYVAAPGAQLRPMTETLDEWHATRPGRGNWGGDGARAHYRPNPPKVKSA